MSKTLNYYCQKFSKLRVDRARGIAPHKPILLLCVIELIEQGKLKQNRILLNAELIATFLKFWKQLGSETHRADIALPFFHLRIEGFWHLQANPGFELTISSKVKPKTIKDLREAVWYAYLDDELFDWLQNPSSRASLVSILISAWFSTKTQQIEESLGVDAFQEFQDEVLETGGAIYQPIDLEDEAKVVVRDAAFRKVLVSIYEYRCAFCGLQTIDSFNQNIVDGAHIKPFAMFYDDRIDNGISFCKNHHWAFDRGWFAIDDDYNVLISDDLREESPHATPIREFQKRRLRLPAQERYHPRIEAVRWHRENVFQDLSLA